MKRQLLLFVGIMGVMHASAQIRIQGQPYDMSKASRTFKIPESLANSSNSASFTFDQIENWSGKGANKSAVAIQWNHPSGKNAWVWGYKWDGEATGEMMLRQIAKEDPRFVIMSEEGTTFGSTISGIGYDANGDGQFAIIKDGIISKPNENGVILVSGYSYDGYKSVDPEDYWQSGWYDGYWSYWVKATSESGWGFSGSGATGRVLTPDCWDGWNFSAGMQSYNWLPLAPAPKASVDYTQGTFIINEDWFGHDYGSVNFLTSDYEMLYRVYRAENSGENLGITTQFGTIYGDNFYFVSKQANNSSDITGTGGRLVVADARTLKKKAAFENIGGGDGRSFLGVNDLTGYIGSSNGIFLFDMDALKVGDLIAGTGGGSSYNGQIGNMVRLHNRVFALKQAVGILVVDALTHELQETISYPSASMLTVGADGNVWIAISNDNKLVKLNPLTLEANEITCPSGVSISNSWTSWNAGNLCASTTENALFLSTGSVWAASKVVKYDIDKDAFDLDFFTLPGQDLSDKQVLYGAHLRVDPVSNHLIVTATESGLGSHYQKNWIHIVDGTTGELVHTAIPEDYYWFPALVVFPDLHEPVIQLKDPIIVNQEYRCLLKDVVSDADNMDVSILTAVTSHDESILKASVEYPYLVLQGVANGKANVTIQVNSNGKIARKELPVEVSGANGLTDADQGIAIRIYPNPADDILFIEALEASSWIMSDMSGRIVLRNTQMLSKEKVDISSLIPGIYTLTIKNNQNCKSVRFIKR